MAVSCIWMLPVGVSPSQYLEWKPVSPQLTRCPPLQLSCPTDTAHLTTRLVPTVFHLVSGHVHLAVSQQQSEMADRTLVRGGAWKEEIQNMRNFLGEESIIGLLEAVRKIRHKGTQLDIVCGHFRILYVPWEDYMSPGKLTWRTRRGEGNFSLQLFCITEIRYAQSLSQI